MLKTGDRVTIYETVRHTPSIPTGVTYVESVSARVVKTKDGRRWSAKRLREVDERGSEKGTRQIAPYREGDCGRVAREMRLSRARSLLKGYDWEIERDFELLSDEDLEALGAIARRLDDARKARDEGKDEG